MVTGASGYGFDRLLRKCDEIAPAIGKRFLLQTGRHPFPARHCETIGTVRYEDLMALYREAELIIGHTSSGPLIYARKFRKPIITTPRRPDLGEAFDDHQVECALALRGAPNPMRVTLESLDDLEAQVRALLAAAAAGFPAPAGRDELASLHARLREACS